VSEDAAPERIAVIWSPEARADLRAIERETAMQILHGVDRYLAHRTGDVQKTQAAAYRLPPPLGRLPGVLRSHGREHHRDHRREEPAGGLSVSGTVAETLASLRVPPRTTDGGQCAFR